MRVFWVLLSLAVVGGLVFVLAPAEKGSHSTATPLATAPAATAPVAVTAVAPSTTPPTISKTVETAAKPPAIAPIVLPTVQAKPVLPPSPAALQAPTPATPAPTAPTTAAESSTAAAKSKPASLNAGTTVPAEIPAGSNTPTPIITPTPAPAKIGTAPQAIPGITDGTSGSNGDGMFAKALETAATSEPVTLPEHPVFKGEKSLPSKAVRKADGSLLVDDRFVVKGSGTAVDPYIVPWDMIVSTQETYKPRLGMTKIPQRVAMLDGKYIKIVGFIAFPITAASPKEALIMLNQWDGCCIGTPPSPYDAIEVKLATPATGGQKTMASGTITGIFKVDPYEDGGWLLGLYLMEDATLTAGEAS